MKDIRFSHLQVHTEFVWDGISSVDELLSEASRLGQSAIAFTDFSTLTAIGRLHLAARRHPEVKPIAGLELMVNTDGRDLSSIVLLARNQEGFRNLIQLSSEANTTGIRKSGIPVLGRSSLEQHSEGLIAISSVSGEIQSRLMKRQHQGADEAADYYKSLFNDDFYFAVQPSIKNDDIRQQLNKDLFLLAKEHDVKVIATNDVYFAKKEDHDAFKVAFSMMPTSGKDCDDDAAEKYLKSTEQMLELFPGHPEVVSNTQEIVDKVERYDFLLSAGPMESSNFEKLRERAFEGLKIIGKEQDDRYVNRICDELSLVCARGCSAVFLAVADMIAELDIDGHLHCAPGFGNTCSFLLNYLLGITSHDPLACGLYSENFLNRFTPKAQPNFSLRLSGPAARAAYRLLTHSLGEGCVAFCPDIRRPSHRQSVLDVYKHYGIDLSSARKVAESIPDNFLGRSSLMPYVDLSCPDFKETRDMARLYQTSGPVEKEAFQMADRLAGVAQGLTAGTSCILMGGEPLGSSIPVMLASDADGREWLTCQYENPVLPVASITIVDEGAAAAMLASSLRNGVERADASCPWFRLLSETDLCLAYDEQIQLLATEVAGFSAEDAYRLKRAATKLIISELEAIKPRFIKGCTEKGHAPHSAMALWELITLGGVCTIPKGVALCDPVFRGKWWEGKE